jgi:hypothetical protein
MLSLRSSRSLRNQTEGVAGERGRRFLGRDFCRGRRRRCGGVCGLRIRLRRILVLCRGNVVSIVKERVCNCARDLEHFLAQGLYERF